MAIYVLVERHRDTGAVMHSWPAPNGLASEATELMLIVASARPELHRHHPATYLRVEPVGGVR